MRKILLLMVMVASLAIYPAAPAGAAEVDVVPVATGLDVPAAFTFAPNGRIFYGERFTGEIRILTPSTGSNVHFHTIPNVVADGERGLLGIALHPDYPDRPFVYAYATRNVGGALRNQILRIRNSDGAAADVDVIFTSDVTPATNHNGGRILFGPDEKLYVVIGDGADPSNSQNLDKDAGKVLRLRAGGGAPAGNPFGASLVWAYGIRNSFGLGFDPLTGRLWETENGPECNDEVNLIVKGRNYGWGPSADCPNTNQSGPDPVAPKRTYTPTIAPTGIAFCVSCGLPGFHGDLFFAAWKDGKIRRAELTASRRGITSVSEAYDHPSGIFSIERGPNEFLYFSDPGGIYKLVALP